MATTQHHDEEPFFVEGFFQASFNTSKKRFPGTRESVARRAIFLMCERIWNNDRKVKFRQESFQAMKSQVISELGIYGSDRSGYHSLLTRYAKLGGFKTLHTKGKFQSTKNAPQASLDEIDWSAILHLCKAEQAMLARAAGEDRLSYAWEPEYKGPVWDNEI